MRLKKILISTSAICLISSPIIALFLVNLLPKKISLNSRYIIDDETTKEQKKILSKALDETIGKDSLIFKFYTLTKTNQYTPSMLSWFVEFNNALKSLDNRLGFELIPRTNQTVETGFRNKNGEMVSMFWSPDYHNIGTWIGFHFYPNYQVPNLWPTLYNFLKSGPGGSLPEDDVRFGPLDSNFQVSKWGKSLISYLEKQFYIKNDPESNLFKSYDDLILLDKKAYKLDSSYSKTGARESIGNEIGIWADLNNDLAMGLLNWMDHQSIALPWISNGPSTILNSLVRKGYHTPNNEYTNINFRDWFYDPKIIQPGSDNFTWWNPSDPFSSNRTPYNPSFNDASNNMFFQSTYNGLLDWKIVGDWEYDGNNWIPPMHSFIISGASSIDFFNEQGSSSGNFKLIRDKLNNLEIDINDINYKNSLMNSKKITFTISPEFIWKDHDYKDKGYLQAQDYFWGFMGYYLSTQLGINTNGYYLNLMNLDINKTIEANSIFYTKDSKGNIIPKINPDSNIDDPDFQKFTIILSKPNINVLDIMSKQFFQPLPINNQTVQNIFKIPTNDSLFDSDGNFITNKLNFNTLYGSGEKKNNYTNWWSVGPYYVDRVSEQDIQFKKNKNYFDVLSKNNTNPFATSKIETITMKYAGAYSPQVTYEQFKTNEIDKSEIPTALIGEAYKNYNSDFRSEGVSIVPRTDLIPYNINIYEFSNKIEDQGFLVPDKNKLKSLISPQYKKAIVYDFDKGINGNSWKIRNAINQSIDWYSLSALAYPNNSPSFQHSILPFGNFRSISGNLTNLPAPFVNANSYYETAANNKEIGFLRRTLEEYKLNWEKQFK